MGKVLNSIEATKLVLNEADFNEVCISDNVFDTLVSAHLD